jgi:thiol-disulfide isomerase/thioredoxin
MKSRIACMLLCLVAACGRGRGETGAREAPPAADAAPRPADPVAACAEPDCLPAFRARTIDGATVETASLGGKVTLVMFWASYCEPCIADGPTIDAVYRRRHADGFDIVAFSRDEADAAAMRRFRDHYRLSYPIVLADDALHAAFGSPSEIPTFFIFGSDGRRRARFEGALKAEILEREIDAALAAAR